MREPTVMVMHDGPGNRSAGRLLLPLPLLLRIGLAFSFAALLSTLDWGRRWRPDWSATAPGQFAEPSPNTRALEVADPPPSDAPTLSFERPPRRCVRLHFRVRKCETARKQTQLVRAPPNQNAFAPEGDSEHMLACVHCNASSGHAEQCALLLDEARVHFRPDVWVPCVSMRLFARGSFFHSFWAGGRTGTHNTCTPHSEIPWGSGDNSRVASAFPSYLQAQAADTPTTYHQGHSG